ncbi:MAG: DUF3179 domain-containing protein [Candidatus Tectomicrobia bacterium]|uniref:DUF3179 domain-containing protein n=1 Tax=Tectimicrobiota bacterium TaxID=2528274 RepID=A0A933GMJ6_UNCTE|nr:DUF3179 domain-containing protein [Candidatus Tectomicrobia bacterium]
MVYSRKVDDKTYTFGVSGRLYKSNVLLYDHQTESLWSQLKEMAVSGPLAVKKLQKFPSRRATWKTWQSENPDTTVLSRDTGYNRDYAVDPYEGYYRALGFWFPIGDVRTDLSAKEMILGIEVEGKAKAYPLSLLRIKTGVLKDKLGNRTIEVEVSQDGEVRGVRDERGQVVPSIFSYWFAWQAFHPDTLVYR